MFVLGLVIGYFLGVITGVVLMALMVASSRDSRERENEYDL